MEKRKRINESERFIKRAEPPKTKTYKPDLSVWSIIQSVQKYHKEDPNDVDWDIQRDYDRIKATTQKYAGFTITEAFKDYYKDDIITLQNDTMQDLAMRDTYVGQIIPLKIVSVSKDDVVFDSINYKEIFITRNNLWKYPRFKEFLPTKPVNCLVVEKTKKYTVVDIIKPMIDEYLRSKTIEPWRQNKIKDIETVKVKNLQITKGGFVGDMIIPDISDFLGIEFTIQAFVPGSQLTLNASNDYDRWKGQDVETFITSYDPTARGAQVVCSRKSYIRHLGNLEMLKLFNKWCDNTKEWDDFSSTIQNGVVTGVINSSRKCGVFVEYIDKHITGMIAVPPSELTSYTQDLEIQFKFKEFEEDLVYDDVTGQLTHTQPFEIVDGAIKSVNVKPIFEIF